MLHVFGKYSVIELCIQMSGIGLIPTSGRNSQTVFSSSTATLVVLQLNAYPATIPPADDFQVPGTDWIVN